MNWKFPVRQTEATLTHHVASRLEAEGYTICLNYRAPKPLPNGRVPMFGMLVWHDGSPIAIVEPRRAAEPRVKKFDFYEVCYGLPVVIFGREDDVELLVKQLAELG